MSAALNSIKLSQIQQKTYPDANDMVLAYSSVTGSAVLLTVGNLYAGSNLVLTVNTIILTNNTTPVNSVVPTPQGTMWFDQNYLYLAVSNTELKRVALSAF